MIKIFCTVNFIILLLLILSVSIKEHKDYIKKSEIFNKESITVKSKLKYSTAILLNEGKLLSDCSIDFDLCLFRILEDEIRKNKISMSEDYYTETSLEAAKNLKEVFINTKT